MYRPTFLYICIRYILKNTFDQYSKLSSWMSLIGIIIGIFSLILITSIMNGFEKNLEQNILKYVPHIILKYKDNVNSDKNLVFSNKKKCSNIKSISSFITTHVLIQSKQTLINGFVSDIDSVRENLFLLNIDNKTLDQLLPGQYKIAIGYELSKILNVHINDRIRLIFPKKNNFTIIGLIPTQRIFTVSDIFYTNSEMDKNQLFINASDLKNIMHYPNKYIDGWRLWLKDPFNINLKNIQSCFTEDYLYQDWHNYKKELFHAIKMEKNITLIFLSLVIIVSICNICIALSVEIIYKKQEIAILKTQGCQKNEIFLIFICYGFINGAIGIAIGNVLGALFSYYLNDILFVLNVFNNIFLPIQISWKNILYMDIIFIIFIIVSTVYPSYKAITIKPAESLKYE
ncbi:MAG: FtsX-like permease family protein [Wigglesworthia glossinidia]|nr:FtsX-like permease family protein [Wigglesworthia glossinidia]